MGNTCGFFLLKNVDEPREERYVSFFWKVQASQKRKRNTWFFFDNCMRATRENISRSPSWRVQIGQKRTQYVFFSLGKCSLAAKANNHVFLSLEKCRRANREKIRICWNELKVSKCNGTLAIRTLAIQTRRNCVAPRFGRALPCPNCNIR